MTTIDPQAAELRPSEPQAPIRQAASPTAQRPPIPSRADLIQPSTEPLRIVQPTDDAPAEADDANVLRVLARKAVGLSGADIERLVREARQKARRERRTLGWSDLADRLAATKGDKPEGLRRRMALHEAGHAVARLAFRLGIITLITIDGPGGIGLVESEERLPREETEDWLQTLLVAMLAGRAAEEELVGSCAAGSGGFAESDLGSATKLALRMEVAFGFGCEMPLLYRDAEQQALLLSRADIAQRVNTRLEHAYAQARELIRSHRAVVEELAAILLQRETLEGPELSRILQGMVEKIATLRLADAVVACVGPLRLPVPTSCFNVPAR
ncbi:MAG TPA: ATP-dependent Zn protease [Tianweitania sediminis]|jgi:cell division protease FtsH|nr:ATP-dependent Zn protease [Tianweitania sediminis]